MVELLLDSARDQEDAAMAPCACRPVSSSLNEEETDNLVGVFKALAHPVRLRMVDLIHAHGGEICVCEFENHFDVKQPTISHHLKILRDAGLIHSRQDRSWVHHFVRVETFERVRAHIDRIAAAHKEEEPLINVSTFA